MNALEEHIAEARSDGIRFALLTVFLTPAFLVVGVFLLLAGAAYADPGFIRWMGYHRTFLTFMNIFFLVAFIAFFARPKARYQVSVNDIAWVGVAIVVLVAMIAASYGTTLAETRPKLFWPLYGSLAFAMLGLLGHAYEPRDDYYLGWFNGMMDDPFTFEDDIDRAHVGLGLAIAVPRALLDAYANIFGSTWLINGLDDREMKLASQFIASLGKSERPKMNDPSMAKVLRVLSKTEVIRMGKRGISLTLDGQRLTSLV